MQVHIFNINILEVLRILYYQKSSVKIKPFKINKLESIFNAISLSLLLTVSILLLSPIEVYGASSTGNGSKTVTVTGMGELGDSVPMARDAAIKDGLRKSVEQIVGVFVESETMVSNFELLSDKIYTMSEGYVETYNVIEEGKLGKDLYKVKLEATVAQGSLKNDLRALGLLHRKVGMPRVLFMIAEQSVGQEHVTYWWNLWASGYDYRSQVIELDIAETTLKEEFLASGFNVVDHSILDAGGRTGSGGGVEINKAYVLEDPTVEGIKEFGTGYGAEVIVKGKALAKESLKKEGSNVGAYMADVSLSAFRVDDGKVLGSATASGVKRHISSVTGGTLAIKDASRKAASEIIEQIIKQWSQASQLVTLKMLNVKSYDDVAQLKKKIESSLPGVRAVYQKSFESTIAEFQIDTDLKGSELADKINKFSKSNDLEVTGSTMNTVEVMFK